VHARGIVHRDLKPDNLFLAREANGRERVKILDFGVARLAEGHARSLKTKSGQTVGTPNYMSPEQATASMLDHRSDLYMMGVVLFELVTGVVPFQGKGYGDVMLMHVHDPPPRLRDLRPEAPQWLDQVVQRCLEKDAQTRYSNARELALALRQEATAEITLPVQRLDELQRGWSTRTVALMVGGALVLGVAAALAAVLLRSPAAHVLEQPAAAADEGTGRSIGDGDDTGGRAPTP
jgi:serine/threonine-protein kinase